MRAPSKSLAPLAGGSGATSTTSSYPTAASSPRVLVDLRRTELLDCAPWEVRLLVVGLVRCRAARELFRTFGVGPSILGHEPEAQTIVAHALAERHDMPEHVAAARQHRRPGHRTWGETIESIVGWDDAWHVSDVRRSTIALLKHWLPDHMRWAINGIEAGDWSRLSVVTFMARALEVGEIGGAA
ncbi:MAG: hypothetical protein AMXMBFR58_24450 [Phycisphaerae bacterium]